MSVHLALAIGIYKYKQANNITLSYEDLVKSIINGLENNKTGFKKGGTAIETSKDKSKPKSTGEVLYKKPKAKLPNGETFNYTTIKSAGIIKLFHVLRYNILSPNLVENSRCIVLLVSEIILRRDFSAKPRHELYHCMVSTVRYETEYNKYIQLKFNQVARVLICLPFDDILTIIGKLIFNYIKWFKQRYFPNKTVEKLIEKHDFLDKYNRMKTGILKPNLFIYLFHTIISTVKLVHPKVDTLILALLIWLDDPMLLDIYHE